MWGFNPLPNASQRLLSQSPHSVSPLCSPRASYRLFFQDEQQRLQSLASVFWLAFRDLPSQRSKAVVISGARLSAGAFRHFSNPL